jgi:serine/threonine protein kinase/Tol biopolymer transport system component
MTLEKNTLLHNRYRVVEILGQGGMGSVYRARDENLGVIVALKENLFTTDEYMRQFRLEAVILANLRHPNLPRVSDHFDLGDQGQYLVMDFIEGEDLRFRMERVGIVPEEDVIKIGAAICDALAYLHTRKPPILHRDIKPGNVKITPEGHIFLVDFGLAKVYQGSGQATTSGARAMTPGYSPPEQYGTARTDPRTDIYSLGATMYAVLCGIIPEDGLARAMDNAKLTPLRKRNPNISRRLAATIEKAMAVDPSDRFQTAEEFKKALLGSRTQNIPGSYMVEPPPAETFLPNDPSEIIEDKKEKTSRVPIGPETPTPVQEEREFVSPLKKQKERERKRRNALMRFIFVLILLFLGSIPFLAPDILPADVRAAIPFLMPTSTATSPPTETPLPTLTLVPTSTSTSTVVPSTATSRPTNTPLASATVAGVGVEATFTATPTITPSVVPSPTSTPTSMATPIGGSGQIAYASNRSGLPQIYLADLASQTVTQITDMPEGACQPSWSPDGEKLVFISPCKGMDEVYYDAGLYIVNADGSNLTPLATVPGGDFDPAWSPDGSAIAFTSLRTGQMEIFVMDLKGIPTATQITKGASSVESRQPAWSPDGSQIAYAVKRFGVYQIWLMNFDGKNQKQIVRSGVAFSDYLPTWSPDGELILFNQRCATTFCFPYLMSISATDRSVEQGTRVQLNVISVENVEYSADGFWLLYEGEEAGENNDILYMTVSGANRVRVTTDKGLDFDPAWRPGG